LEGVTAEALAQKIQDFGHRQVVYAGPLEDAVGAVVAEAKPGDVVMTLGAGSVSKSGDRILAGLKDK
jgi:UDP-N-acetylmuramate--alanine ligase